MWLVRFEFRRRGQFEPGKSFSNRTLFSRLRCVKYIPIFGKFTLLKVTFTYTRVVILLFIKAVAL